jgi:hypothetical protein
MAQTLTGDQAIGPLAHEFELALRELLPSEVTISDAEVPALAQSAAIDAIGKHLWREATGELLDWRGVASRLGVHSRQAVNARYRRGRLLGFERDGRPVFPAWQFDGSGRLYRQVPAVLSAFHEQGVTDGRMVVSWFATEHEGLSGSTPLTWVRSGKPIEPLLLAARRAAFQLAA